ncbi:aminopeptidase P family protein [Phormidium sp. CLA17]|uniref:aminopeptidase P family protein n=1 Tax=Leptolyngbya sp. Cla-17 TaxID=2803751 RepID=UPI00149113BB|nr:aminopeptidase P family protein [Leptolyngbya sp. Cla-17]MBM0742957.1 aminopeptidase P family protein [Leptolyngbya sp. Cla-17]
MTPTDLLSAPIRTTDVAAKLTVLRSLFADHALDAYLIPSADEHLNEYLPEVKQRRKWASGFTGSSGDFLVGQTQAWVFVDSRYYEQADLEVNAAVIQVSKLGLDDHKTLEEVVEELGRTTQAEHPFRLGYDPFTLSISQFREFHKKVEPYGVVLVAIATNLVDQVRSQSPWINEILPAYADSPLFHLPDEQTGEAIAQKLARTREKLAKASAQILPITKLDQIAWLFNLRGWDVSYNPVFIAYAIVTAEQAFLFTNEHRIEPTLRQFLALHVTLLPYDQYVATLRSLLTLNSRVLIDPKHTTMGTYQILKPDSEPARCKIAETANPIEEMKARKNAIEIAQMQQANLKASRAKTRTIKWLFDQLEAENRITEADVAATIEVFYQAEASFQGLSFNTIAGSGSNSSIVHYGTPNPQKILQPGELLLLDSGAQYAAGTTDDTRTVAVGVPTSRQIECYTEVLKAHINCAMQQFPKGTTGAQLDGITRSTLWHAGLDYGHGTGHGVGAFLNVHEGPNGISKRVSQSLEPGMITSIEPGFYQPGWGGIRIENLYVIVEMPQEEKKDSDEAKTPWYGFESLTYIPFDNRLIDLSSLDSRQHAWLQRYYHTIVAKLTPTLSQADADWLKRICTL